MRTCLILFYEEEEPELKVANLSSRFRGFHGGGNYKSSFSR